MTDATLKILIDGLVPAAGAIAAITAAISAVAAIKRQAIADKKLNELKEETGKIHTLTNSNLSELTKAYQVLIEKSAGQDRAIATLETDKREEAARADRSSATAAALALPATDAKIVNGGKKIDKSDRIDRIDRIASIKDTVEETSGDVKHVKTALGDRVEKVEEKLDEKKDK